MRRTMLYLPGNSPKMLIHGRLFEPDVLVMDLKDSVSAREKDAARILVREILRCGDFGECEVTVKINDGGTEYWREDIAAAVPCGIAGIVVPRVESPQMVGDIDEELSDVEERSGLRTGCTKIFCLLDTAAGVWNAYDIAKASPRVTAILPGGEELAADLRSGRSKEGAELDWIRRMLIVAARAAGVDAIDTVFPYVNDEEGLRRETAFIKQLGFDGKSVIHPNQIPIVREVYASAAREIETGLRQDRKEGLPYGN